MKRLSLLFVLLSIGACSLLHAQKITMDSVMRKVSKGKPFVLTILNAGKALPAEKAIADKLHADHLIHLFQLEKDGEISIFGPVTDEKSTIRGIVIFNTDDLDRARKNLEDDPLIKDGYLKYELYPWFTIPGQTIPIK